MIGRKIRIVLLCCVAYCASFVVKGQESVSWPCAVNGAAYGNIHVNGGSSPVQQWAPLVGKACADSEESPCFSNAIEWSSVALEHGNRPVNSEDECAVLCTQVEECQVWTFWPLGSDMSNGELPTKPKCDLCPASLGGSFDPEQRVCVDNGDCFPCSGPYEANALYGIPDDAEHTCEDARGWFEVDISCCTYDEQNKEAYVSPATCELYRATPNQPSVLSFGVEAITGPKDCSSTVWLPFLETVHNGNDAVQEEETSVPAVFVNHTLNGYCDMCPEEYGFQLLPTNEVCYDDGSCGVCQDPYNAVKDGFIQQGDCESNTQWFLYGTGCCVIPENPIQPTLGDQETSTAAPQVPIASDGRSCWVDKSSYGLVKDGACAEADIVAIYAHPETIQLGRNQGWWKSPVTGQAIEPIPYDGEPYSVLGCHQACMIHAECGGWELRGETCILKATLDCSPTIGPSTSMKNSIAGISGCVDASSDNVAENSAVDTSNLWFFDCSRPRCTKPYSYGGSWAGDTYIPDAKDQNACWYKQYTPDELFDGCVQDRWIVITGGSNTLSLFVQMTNLFVPLQGSGDLEPLIHLEYEDDGVNLYPMIDLVFRSGSLPIQNRTSDGIIHLNKKRFCDVDPSLPCYNTSLTLPDDQVDWPKAYGAALDSFLADAPYEAGATRLTLVVGQFWSAASETLRAIDSLPQNTGWAASNFIFYAQVMTWYHCNLFGWCDIPALGSTKDEMLKKYQSDLDGFFETGKSVCDSERADCFLATAGAGSTPGPEFKAMIQALEEMTGTYEWANFIDYNGFIFDEEIVTGHLMPSMFLPVFAMMWNTVCDGPEVGCPQAISSSPNCWTDCSDRRGESNEVCSDCFDWWDDWTCANEVQCDAQVLEHVPWHVATSVGSYFHGEEANTCFLAEQEINVQRSEGSSGYDESENETDSCQNRIWCGTNAQGWVVGSLVFLAGMAVIAYSHVRSNQTEKKKKEKKTKTLIPEGDKDASVTEDEKSVADSSPTTRRVSERTSSMTLRSSACSSISFVTSAREVDAIIAYPSIIEDSSTSKADADNSTTFARRPHDRRPSGPVCVDDFVDGESESKHLVFDLDSISASASEVTGDTRSDPVCVDDFIDLATARYETQASTRDELNNNVSRSSAADVENQVPASRSRSGVSEQTVASTAPKQAASSKDYLRSIGVARLIASIHIVLGHLYAKGVTANVYWFGWGFTWVPWFFMLSGYVLTHARLNSRDPTKVDGPYAHIAKRLSTIFPMYAVGVLLSMLIRILRDLALPGYDVLVGQSFLMQSWIPLWTEQALLTHCWFLSNMVLYWAAFGIVYSFVRRITLFSALSALAVITVLPWFLVIIPSASKEIDADWYSDHSWGSTDTATDVWTVMLKFNPIFYAHVFLYGMLLSVLRHRVKNADSNNQRILTTVLSCCMRFGATFGYLGLTLVFTIVDLQPSGYKLSARLSVLLPLQGLVLLGLSPLPELVSNKRLIDPLAYLFAFGPPWIGDVSYCQYILQFIMYNLFPVTQITNASYFLYLLGASMLTYKSIQHPAANAWRKFLPKKEEDGPLCFLPSFTLARIIFLPPTVLAVFLIIGKSAYIPGADVAGGSNSNVQSTFNGTNATSVPDVVRVASEAVGLRLNWTMESSTEEGPDLLLINPSILFQYDENGDLEWVRAARAHAVEENTTQGWYEDQQVTEQLLSFQSLIMLSREQFVGDLSAGFDDEGIELWGLNGVGPLSSIDSRLISHVGKGSAWNDLCEPKPDFNRENSWLVRKRVSGPEDPKLIQLTSDASSRWGLTFSSFPPASLLSLDSSQEECKWTDEAVMQMYIADDGSSLASGGDAHGTKLQCGNPVRTEKNWIAFSHEGALYFIYSIVPHTIVQVREADGECIEQYKTSSGDMMKLSKRVSAVRGSASAIRYSETEYLALLHTREPSVGYSTHAYTFEATPPFAVKRVSKKIPLQGGGRAFPSSLSLIHDKVLIGYGDNDQVARVYVMSRTALEETFDWCSDSAAVGQP